MELTIGEIHFDRNNKTKININDKSSRTKPLTKPNNTPINRKIKIKKSILFISSTIYST